MFKNFYSINEVLVSWNSSRSVILLFLFTLFLFEMCTFFHVCFFICSSLKWLTGRPRAICGQRYPLPCFAWLWIGMRGSKEVALIGMKSCRTQGDFVCCLSVHPSVPPRPSQAWNLPSQAWNLPWQAGNLPSQALNWRGQIKAWEDRFQAWEGRFQAWEDRYKAWEGRFQA